MHARAVSSVVKWVSLPLCCKYVGPFMILVPLNTRFDCGVVHELGMQLLIQFHFSGLGFCRIYMDSIVDSPSSAYQEFIATAAGALEAKESSGGQNTPATDAALENFKQWWEMFRVYCDQAEEFVESVKQRIGSECLVDEATGFVASKPGQTVQSGLPPISVVRLEQMSKAVRWLVIELQQGSGTGGGSSHHHAAAPFDARFTEDATQ